MTENIKPIDDPKERAHCLLGLYAQKLDHFKQTREIEFKVNIAIWTLIVSAGAFLYGKVYLECKCLYLLISFIVISVHWTWMDSIQNSEDTGHEFMNVYSKAIEKMAGVSTDHICTKRRGMGWVALEVTMTAVLLFGVGIILSIPPFSPEICSLGAR